MKKLITAVFILIGLSVNAQYISNDGTTYRLQTAARTDRKFLPDTVFALSVRGADTTGAGVLIWNNKDTTSIYQIRDTAFLRTTATIWDIKPELPCCVTILTGSAALNFGSIGAHDEETLNITVTGASVGDVVSVGIPNSAMVTYAQYNVWVSDTNVVSVKCYNNNGGTINPPSATFKVKVFK
jgi:hypothetical protein